MEGQPLDSPPQQESWPQLADHIWQLFETHGSSRMVFHHFAFAKAMAERANDLAMKLGMSPADQEAVNIGAWFYTSGYWLQYNNPIRKTRELAQQFLVEQQVSDEVGRAVLEGLPPDDAPKSPIARVTKDAYLSIAYGQSYPQQHHLLRLEREWATGQQYSKLEWAQQQLNELLSIQFNTPLAHQLYGQSLAQHILLQQQQKEKQTARSITPVGQSKEVSAPFRGLENETTIRTIQTYFRTNYRNHIHLSSIADDKARIMISANTILISVLITLLSYRNIAETQPMILLPVVLFLVTGLTSLTFAILAARPRVTSGQVDTDEPVPSPDNVVFFGNFVELDLEQYEVAVDRMFRDSESLIGNMARDLYFLGKVLDKKYRFLSVSYNIFLVGFIVTVISFLIALFA
ncbi:MAG: hypothetical protein F6K19_11565 [Cyanothece sp. SIO1E1]|nr:hypothetical protein [Cyanothece sp. SIO1E1]